MRDDLQKLINAERKYQREVKELRDLRTLIMQQRAPEKQILDAIDAELAKYLGRNK